MSPRKLCFLVIDDSKLNCFIAEKVIRNNDSSSNIHVFIEAEAALEFVKNRIAATDCFPRSIIILDIQMPVMNGFEFVEKFEQLPDTIKMQYDIFMISSSVNENDRNRASNYSSVKQLLVKPFTKDMLAHIINFMQQH